MKLILGQNPTLYVPLHKNDGTQFMSGDAYGHLCTVNGALWRPNGRYLDGINDFIDCGNNIATSIGPTGGLTAAAWYKTEWTSLTGDRLLGKYNTGGGTYWGFYTNSGKLRWYCPNVVESDANIWDGQFHHIAGVRRAGGAIGEIFIDGKLSKSSAVTPTDFTWSVPFSIGRWGNLNSEYAKGIIGEVCVFSLALTPSEIQDMYLATKWRYQ